MLEIPGAVEAAWPDEGVAAHYGDPVREQRAMTKGQVLVDRSSRGVVKVSGPDRLSWLHSLTSQHLERLAPGQTQQALILSPQGHLEHHLTLTDDGSATWIQVEPHTAKTLVDYLNSMRFMLRVEVEDLSGVLVVQTLAGPLPAEGGIRTVAADSLPSIPSLGGEGVVTAVMQHPFGFDLIVQPEVSGQLAADLPVAGLWAFEAARIAARIPRPGLDTDHKTLPHEIGLIEDAVHLSKGCYRGQETVARIHNLGHPPRRLVFLHLDGSADRLPGPGSPLTRADGTTVGFVGSAARHFELGPIGLGLVKRSVDVNAPLLADGVAAAQEVIVPPDAGANVQVTLRRDSVPQPPANRRMLLSPGGTTPVPPGARPMAKSAIVSGARVSAGKTLRIPPDRLESVIAILGTGKMGEALLSGLLRAGRPPAEVAVVVRREARAEELRAAYGVSALSVAEAAAQADTLVIAVKPQDMFPLLVELGSMVKPSQLIISLAAGITTARIEQPMPVEVPVVRVMSNTPALVDEAMSVVSAGSHATEEHLRRAEALFAPLGKVIRVPEYQQDAATALSGSGPAYVFFLVEAMVDAGVLLGLPRQTALEMVTQTVYGAATMLRDGAHPVILRDAVTSPAGTTIAAIRELEKHGVRAAFLAAIEAARDRGRELGRAGGSAGGTA